MARLRDAVICEWTETVNTPAAQTRFKHFINSPQRDPNVQVVPEREQHRPATPGRAHSRHPGGGEPRMSQWVNICNINDTFCPPPACALLVNGDRRWRFSAPMRHDEQVFAISNIDPFA